MNGTNNSDHKIRQWFIRIVAGLVCVWLAYVAADTVIKIIQYLIAAALPLWLPQFRYAFAETQGYVNEYAAAIHLFVWLLFAVGYYNGLGAMVWRWGSMTENIIRYPILAVGFTILSHMLGENQQMSPISFFILIGISIVAYFIIKVISGSFKI